MAKKNTQNEFLLKLEWFSDELLRSIRYTIDEMEKEERSNTDIVGAILYLICSGNVGCNCAECEDITEKVFEVLKEHLTDVIAHSTPSMEEMGEA